MGVAGLKVAGPVHLYYRAGIYPVPSVGPNGINSGSGAGATYLGTCEFVPEPQFKPAWKPIFNAISGDLIPMDRMYMGQDGLIAMNLNRFDYDAAIQLLNTPRLSGAPELVGTDTWLDRGSLMVSNALSFELWLQFQFYGTPNALAYPDMPAGYYFYCCQLMDHTPKNLGLADEQLFLVAQAQNVYAPLPGDRYHSMYTILPQYFSGLPNPA